MDCPFCGAEMENGVLQSTHGIHYYRKPCFAGVPFNPKARNEALGQSNGPLQPPFITVSRYPACRKTSLTFKLKEG
jgi:hypothetical protein